MHAAHGVVCRWMYRGGLFRQIETVAQASLINAREMVLHRAGSEMGHVQKHVRRTGAGDLADDGAAHDVAAGEFIGEAFAFGVPEERAIASQSFRQQKTRRLIEMERRGMELNKLDIANHGPRPPGHRHAVAGSNIGIRCFFVDTA